MPRKPRKLRKPARTLYNEVGEGKTVYYAPLDSLDAPKPRSCFQGGNFMLIGLDTYRILRELDIPISAHKVMYWLCEHNFYGSSCAGWTQAQIAKDCKIPSHAHQPHDRAPGAQSPHPGD